MSGPRPDGVAVSGEYAGGADFKGDSMGDILRLGGQIDRMREGCRGSFIGHSFRFVWGVFIVDHSVLSKFGRYGFLGLIVGPAQGDRLPVSVDVLRHLYR